MDVTTLSLKEIIRALESKEFSSEDLVSAYLSRIEKLDGDLYSVLEVSPSALEDARKIDKARSSGQELGSLAGVPIFLKDNMMVKGWGNTSASQVLEGHKSVYNATVVDRLKSAGAVLLGRTNMDEFAMGSSTESSHFGTTKNPWDKTRVPGGSSGGSAVAVSAGFAPVALGSDTGGSIRQPASLCGVVGLKPTYGRVSRYGLMAMASSLDQIGPFARTVEDVAFLMQTIEGKDQKDATSVELSETSISELIEPTVDGLTIGIPKEYFLEGMDADVKRLVMDAVAELEKGGAKVVEISMPHVQYALAVYYVLMPCEASSNLGRFDGLRYGYHSTGENLTETYSRSRGEGFGPEVKRRIMLGSYALSAGYYDAYYRKALKVRSLIKKDFDEVLKHVDAIVTPTSPSVAWKLGEKFGDPLTMYLSDIYTITANLATVPAMSLPCGFSQDLPVGLQLMGRPFDEHMLYRIGMYYQSVTEWHKQTPIV
ncbi:Asp-tRNA(Asn)/Glu-tRNA(Gln) amidotransferase subunit GatA [Candidatus Uhrbacteria bacterium]|nr:Asp-tRNA(Asn)/Glu-tRNA(Gln) amidotransferase subunit GatA [Candidatus Uhrbacteria bacterium]